MSLQPSASIHSPVTVDFFQVLKTQTLPVSKPHMCCYFCLKQYLPSPLLEKHLLILHKLIPPFIQQSPLNLEAILSAAYYMLQKHAILTLKYYFSHFPEILYLIICFCSEAVSWKRKRSHLLLQLWNLLVGPNIVDRRKASIKWMRKWWVPISWLSPPPF